ncbi:hypothetical protein [Winogradskyella tangerina]|uniref:hypothetical protein n=1 Tax=Winogradskyella tangerina TaxID=2023240 RepID=UPI0013007656|nr:hypothetical protein [Winogradskyella tangerina]
MDNDNSEIKDHLLNNFKFFNNRIFFEPFKGFVCQSSDRWKSHPFEKFPDNFFKNQDEVENHFEYGIEDKLMEISKAFPEKEIAFIDVDCFGGACTSDGFIIKNQEKIFVQEPHHSSHITLLQKIHPGFNSWFFYPFTRTFFTDIGGINGDIINFSFAAVWLAVSQEFGENKDYNLQAAANEMFLDCPNEFNLYFMKVNDNWIKIMGSILQNNNTLFQKVKDLIEDMLLGMEYNIEINNLENGETTVLKTIDQEKNKEIKATSYRTHAFNSQTIDLSANHSSGSNDKSPKKKKNFFQRLFGK